MISLFFLMITVYLRTEVGEAARVFSSKHVTHSFIHLIYVYWASSILTRESTIFDTQLPWHSICHSMGGFVGQIWKWHTSLPLTSTGENLTACPVHTYPHKESRKCSAPGHSHAVLQSYNKEEGEGRIWRKTSHIW